MDSYARSRILAVCHHTHTHTHKGHHMHNGFYVLYTIRAKLFLNIQIYCLYLFCITIVFFTHLRGLVSKYF